MNSMTAAEITGIISGMFDAILLEVEPLFKEPERKKDPGPC